jgi:hypothetical protein
VRTEPPRTNNALRIDHCSSMLVISHGLCVNAELYGKRA